MNAYTIFGSFTAHSGKTDELLAILTSGHDMNSFPGCQEYRVFTDAENPDNIWIFEIWDSPEAHQQSLEDKVIKAQIEKALPLIASFPHHFTLVPYSA